MPVECVIILIVNSTLQLNHVTDHETCSCAYSAVFYKVADHDNPRTFQLPNHTPQVIQRELVGTCSQPTLLTLAA